MKDEKYTPEVGMRLKGRIAPTTRRKRPGE
jgi:hypothetical protein